MTRRYPIRLGADRSVLYWPVLSGRLPARRTRVWPEGRCRGGVSAAFRPLPLLRRAPVLYGGIAWGWCAARTGSDISQGRFHPRVNGTADHPHTTGHSPGAHLHRPLLLPRWAWRAMHRLWLHNISLPRVRGGNLHLYAHTVATPFRNNTRTAR